MERREGEREERVGRIEGAKGRREASKDILVLRLGLRSGKGQQSRKYVGRYVGEVLIAAGVLY